MFRVMTISLFLFRCAQRPPFLARRRAHKDCSQRGRENERAANASHPKKAQIPVENKEICSPGSLPASEAGSYKQTTSLAAKPDGNRSFAAGV